MTINDIDVLKNRKELMVWVNFLCKEDKELEYLFCNYIYEDKRPIIKCISELQNFVKLTGRGKDITAELIDKEIKKNNIKAVKICLEELFLEPINDTYIKRLENTISRGINGQDFVDWNNKNKRHIALLLNPNIVLNKK